MKKNKKFIITSYGLISTRDIINDIVGSNIKRDPVVQEFLSQLEDKDMESIAEAWAKILLPDLRNSPMMKQMFMDDLQNGHSKIHIRINDDGSYEWNIPINNSENDI